MNEFQQSFANGLAFNPISAYAGRSIGGGLGAGYSPFAADPVSAACAQMAQQLPFQAQSFGAGGQGANPYSVLQSHMHDPISQIARQQFQLAQLQQLAQQQQQQQQQPFGIGAGISSPYQSLGQLGQLGQLSPQGWFGNLISAVGQPLGGAIGGLFGQGGVGSAIGGIASQIGRVLPFQADPMQAFGAQQQHPLLQQLQQQQILQQLQQLQQIQQLQQLQQLQHQQSLQGGQGQIGQLGQLGQGGQQSAFPAFQSPQFGAQSGFGQYMH